MTAPSGAVGDARKRIEDLVDRSSFGTPEAKALRDSVTDEQAARVVTRAHELEAEQRDPQAVEGVGTGAGRGGDPAPTEATPWVNGSADCPEAPAQAHPLDQWTHHDPATRALIAEAVQAERERIAKAIERLADEWEAKYDDHLRAGFEAESELVAALQVSAGSVRKLCADELRARIARDGDR